MGSTTLPAKWTQLSLPDLPRSSHILSFLKPSTVFLFSGELQPREPVPNDVFLANIGSGFRPTDAQACRTVVPDSSTPDPRVGSAAASTGGKSYVFSGRAGKDFSTSDTTLYEFDAESRRWRTIAAPAETKSGTTWPDARSYHAMTATDSSVYVHAGCGATGGRLNDLWKYDIKTSSWTKLADAPGLPRGGTSIVASTEGTRLYRLGGFDGKKEIGGSIDVYEIKTNTWTSEGFENGPIARSVAGLAASQVNGSEYLVYIFGESDPSNLGHAGAGKFLGDVWVYDVEKQEWLKVSETGNQPAPRGWFTAVDVGKQRVLLQGGLGESNERFGDWWILHLDP